MLGPLVDQVGGEEGAAVPAATRPGGTEIDHEPVQPEPPRFTGFSASHTINGHSVILRLKYGNFSFLFAGDLNEEAERDLVKHHADKLT